MPKAVIWSVYIIGIALLALAVWATMRVDYEHAQAHLAMSRYMDWERAAQEMREASEYLTLQARQYAKTLNRSHAEKYLKELYNTKSRENSLGVLYNSEDEKPSGSSSLAEALERSDSLAKKELYALRLLAEASGDDMEDLKALVKNVRLTSADQALNNQERVERARDLLFNSAYDMDQREIMAAIQQFVAHSNLKAREFESAQGQKLDKMVLIQYISLAGLFLCLSILLVPAIKSVKHAEDDF